MDASAAFKSAKTKGEGLYTSFRAVLDKSPGKDKDQAARALYDISNYNKTINPRAPQPDSVTYFERLQLNTTDVLVRGSITYNGKEMRED
jgi:hypothetical protein